MLSWQNGKIILVACLVAATLFGPAPQARADLVGHGGMVRAIDISPNGAQVLTGSFDFTARLWDFGLQSELAVFDDHEGPVTSVAFLPSGARALTGSDDMTAILWDLGSIKMLRRLEGHAHKVMAVAAGPDDRLVATGSWDKTVRLWDVDTGDTVRIIELDSPVNAVTFVGADLIAVGTQNARVHLFETASGRVAGTLEGHRMGITGLHAAPDGARLLSASIDKTIRVWNIADLEEERMIQVRDGQVFDAVFSPDGGRALTAGRDGFVIDWDLAAAKAVREIKAHDRIVWAVRYTPDGRFAISGSSDDHARIWHLETGERIGEREEEGEAEEHRPWLTSDHPGAKLYTSCARCHALTPEGPRRSGPHLYALFGRPAGSVPGYKYSRAFDGKDFVWDEQTLFDLFDRGPDKVLPGTKMPVQRVTDSTQLKNLVAYLKILTSGGE